MDYYSPKEIQKHCTLDDCWLVVKNKVYNVTDFIKKHPIGPDSILFNSNENCIEHYNFHSNKAKKIWDECQIGYIETHYNCCIS
jgi:cytochrome b involved in lipid metabolism